MISDGGNLAQLDRRSTRCGLGFFESVIALAIRTTTFAGKLPQDESFQAMPGYRPCKIGDKDHGLN
jgi:hypothetical protein